MLKSKWLARIAGFSAIAVATTFSPANAASIGGASLDIEGSVSVIEIPGSQEPGGAFVIDVDGSFFAESLITDFDAVRNYEASLVIQAGGESGVGTIFDESIPIGLTSVNGLLADFGADISDINNLIGFVASEPSDAIAFADLFGQPGLFGGLSFDISNVETTSNSIGGDFGLIVSLDGLALDELTLVLGEALGIGLFEPEFDFAITAAITPVPVPAALPMLLGGFAVLGFFGWRRKAVA